MPDVFVKIIIEKLKEGCKPLGIGLCPDWRYIRDVDIEKIVKEVAALTKEEAEEALRKMKKSE